MRRDPVPAIGRCRVTRLGLDRIWGRALGRLGRALAAAVFPRRCAVCGAWLDPAGLPAGTAGGAVFGTLLCAGCHGRLPLIDPPLCRACGRPFDQHPGRDHWCAACLQGPPLYAMARSAAVYAPPVDTLVRRLKYHGRIQTARPLGELLRTVFWRHWAGRPVDLIVPVPLHRRRLRARGFNQVQVMLRHWSRPGPHPDLAPVNVAVVPAALVRRRHTPAQTGLDRPARVRNLRGAFAVPQAGRVRARRVLLVDDVLTTGATAGACTRALLDAGAARVDVLTLARAM